MGLLHILDFFLKELIELRKEYNLGTVNSWIHCVAQFYMYFVQVTF